MSLLKQDITKKRRVNKKTLSKLENEFEAGNNKEYEFKVIINRVMYDKKVRNNKMLGLYYLICR